MTSNHACCAISGCKNTGRTNREVIYHSFPTDERRCKIWVLKCNRKDKVINTKVARVCSSHFLPEDYERDLENELLGLPLRKRLRSDAIPSQGLLHSHTNDNTKTALVIEERLRKRKLPEKVDENTKKSPPKRPKRKKQTLLEQSPNIEQAPKETKQKVKEKKPRKASKTSNKAPETSNEASETSNKASKTSNKASERSKKSSETSKKSSVRSNKGSRVSSKAFNTSEKASDTSNKEPDTSNEALDTPNNASDTSNKASDTPIKTFHTPDKSCDTSNKEPDTPINLKKFYEEFYQDSPKDTHSDLNQDIHEESPPHISIDPVLEANENPLEDSLSDPEPETYEDSWQDTCNDPEPDICEDSWQNTQIEAALDVYENSLQHTQNDQEQETNGDSELKEKLLPYSKTQQSKDLNMGRSCFVCDERTAGDGVSLVLGHTPYSNTELPTKIGQLMGDNFMVIVTHEDVLCKRCSALFNHLDKLEFDMNIVKKALIGYLKKKYNLQDEPPLIADAADVDSLQSASNEQALPTQAAAQRGSSAVPSNIKISSVESLSETNTTDSILSSVNKVANNVAKNTEKNVAENETEEATIFRCTSCKFTSANFQLYMQHLKTHPKRTYFKCSECFKQFETREEAQQHIKSFHEVSDGEENTTGKSVNGQDSVQSKRGYKCGQCGYRYLNKDDYDEHMETHSRATFHECTICTKRFKSKAYLLKHMKNHKIYKCGICSVSFKIKSNLLKHFAIHKKGGNVELQTQKSEQSAVEDTSEGEEEEEGEDSQDANANTDGERRDENDAENDYDQVEEMLKALHSEGPSAGGSEEGKEELSQKDALENDTLVSNDQSESLGEITDERMDTSGENMISEDNSKDDSLNNMPDLQESDNAATEDNEQMDSLPEGMSDLLENIKSLQGSVDTSVEKLGDIGLHLEQMEVQSGALDGDAENSNMLEEKNDLMESIDNIIATKKNSSGMVNEVEVGSPKIDDEDTQVKKKIYVCSVCGLKHSSADLMKRHFKSHTVSQRKKLKCNICNKVLANNLRRHVLSHSSNSEELECSMCEEKLHDRLHLKQHIIDKHTAKVKCSFCDEQFNGVKACHEHELTHPEKYIYKCNDCSQSFETELKLKEHRESIHNDTTYGQDENRKIFKCHLCSLILRSFYTLKRHLIRHNKKGFQKCSVCSLQCKTITEWKHHITEVHPKCPFCSLVFTNRVSYRKHELNHKVNFSYECSVCKKKFLTEALRNKHKNIIHREDMNCRKCGKHISNSIKLWKHERTHEIDLSLPCKNCGRIFKTHSGLRNHMLVHTGKYPYYCQYCGRGLYSKKFRDEHLASHTQEIRFICDICGRKFVSDSTYRIHKTWHENPYPYKCDVCGQKFKHTSAMSVHKRSHTGERPYTCSYCYRKFTTSSSLKKHVILHTKEFPHRCTYCDKGFTTRAKIATHMAKAHHDNTLLLNKKRHEYKMALRPSEIIMAESDSGSDTTGKTETVCIGNTEPVTNDSHLGVVEFEITLTSEND